MPTLRIQWNREDGGEFHRRQYRILEEEPTQWATQRMVAHRGGGGGQWTKGSQGMGWTTSTLSGPMPLCPCKTTAHVYRSLVESSDSGGSMLWLESQLHHSLAV